MYLRPEFWRNSTAFIFPLIINLTFSKSAESAVDQLIEETFFNLRYAITVPSYNQIPQSFSFATCSFIRDFSRYFSEVSLFCKRLEVSCVIFHVFMYTLFFVSILNSIYFIVFSSSTELLLSSMILKSSLPFIFYFNYWYIGLELANIAP